MGCAKIVIARVCYARPIDRFLDLFRRISFLDNEAPGGALIRKLHPGGIAANDLHFDSTCTSIRMQNDKKPSHCEARNPAGASHPGASYDIIEVRHQRGINEEPRRRFIRQYTLNQCRFASHLPGKSALRISKALPRVQIGIFYTLLSD